MLFLTLLDRPSAVVMEGMIASVLLEESGATGAKALNSLLKAPLFPSRDHVQFEQYWIEKGTFKLQCGMRKGSTFCSSPMLHLNSLRCFGFENIVRIFVLRSPMHAWSYIEH